MKILNIYFDYINVNGNIVIGVVAYDGERKLSSCFRKIEKLDKELSELYNHFHCTLKSLEKALEEYINYNKNKDKTKIVLLNQNSLIFKWLSEQNCNIDYMDLMNSIFYLIYECINYTSFEYKVIKGKDNKAKKLLKNDKESHINTNKELDFSKLKERLFKAKEKVEEKKVAN